MVKSDIESEPEDQRRETSDPVLSLLGVGRQVWEGESGDRFVERLRSGAALPSRFHREPCRLHRSVRNER